MPPKRKASEQPTRFSKRIQAQFKRKYVFELMPSEILVKIMEEVHIEGGRSSLFACKLNHSHPHHQTSKHQRRKI